jgi:Serine/Threonine/Tyrosine Kinase found in polyvalent proteins
VKKFSTNLIELKNELQDIINGKVFNSQNQPIQTTQAYLRSGKAASKGTEGKQYNRQQEEERLKSFIEQNNLWYKATSFGTYITEGAEQKVYFPENADYVIKISDAIFYQFWEDYFSNLLIHNHLFPDTAYELPGFHLKENKIYAVISKHLYYQLQ